MSRLTELKKQYPHFNVSVIDVLSELDKSGTYKYLPLYCKLLDKNFTFTWTSSEEEKSNVLKELKSRFDSINVSFEDKSLKMIYQTFRILDLFNTKELEYLVEFQNMNEKGLIPEKDLSRYDSIDMVSSNLTLAQIKEADKEFSKQIVKLYEDEKWVIIRPLTFESSAKYGSGTKWCTTYNSKEYFFRYWYNGILVYFINKVSGYKFAGFKGTQSRESLSFWDSSDERKDFLELEIDDYLLREIKKVFSSEKSNYELCEKDLQSEMIRQYHKYYGMEKSHLTPVPVDYPDEQVVEETVEMVQTRHDTVPTMSYA